MIVDKAAKIVFTLRSYAHYNRGVPRVRANRVEGFKVISALYHNHHNQLKQNITLLTHYQALLCLFCYPDELNQVWT